jgi:hypothetical protein
MHEVYLARQQEAGQRRLHSMHEVYLARQQEAEQLRQMSREKEIEYMYSKMV